DHPEKGMRFLLRSGVSLGGVIPTRIEELAGALEARNYLAGDDLVVAIHLALQLGRPLFLDGETGVGKTEVAKVLSDMTGEQIIQLQCYEGLDVGQALYEWDYARQMLEIRLVAARGGDVGSKDIMSRDFLVARPLLQAIEASRNGRRAVLLIDELDRADEEFEAFLLELLSDFQVTIPEIGTISADDPPILTIPRHRPPQGPGHRRGAGGLVGLCHGASAFDEPVQATRCRRDAGLGRVAPSPRFRVAHPRADRPHSRSGPQVQGRHRGRQGGGRRRTGRMTTTLGDLTSFARELRDAGLGVTPDQIAHMGQALTLVDPAHEPSVRAAFRSLTITDPGQIETFETVFDAFFHRVAEEDAPVYSPEYTQPKAVKPLFAPAEPAPVGDVDTRTGSSATERLAARDFADMDEDQLAEARRLVTTMFWRPPVTRTRRWIPDGGGQRPDMRRTLRRSVGPGGDLLPIEMRRRRVRQRPLIIIADISGSMERYAE